MQPKVRVAKEMILEQAFLMARENGFESVTARALAEKLNCSTQPIFRVYENMEMLRVDLCLRSQEFFTAAMQEYAVKHSKETKSKKNEGKSIFLSMGMAYITLAKEEHHLFQLLCSDVSFDTTYEDEAGNIDEFINAHPDFEVFRDLPVIASLSYEKRNELFTMIWIFTNGLAAAVANHKVRVSNEEIELLLQKAYDAFEHI